ncbi:hypothetical protein BGV68_01345 [Burkholderia ubonensis]|uniref:hypothetical protein n=1 Tax=Burkholderia ubonensis TaxID=101571 RepID=UPI0008FDC307|nr:hypothetical protein [Burkholderia ubonensis]OJA64481.1 hypothetical protein BGV68_01345 [Burkholderia ubonensis]
MFLADSQAQGAPHRARQADRGPGRKPPRNAMIAVVDLDDEPPSHRVVAIAAGRPQAALNGRRAARQKGNSATTWRDQANAFDTAHRNVPRP